MAFCYLFDGVCWADSSSAVNRLYDVLTGYGYLPQYHDISVSGLTITANVIYSDFEPDQVVVDLIPFSSPSPQVLLHPLTYVAPFSSPSVSLLDKSAVSSGFNNYADTIHDVVGISLYWLLLFLAIISLPFFVRRFLDKAKK